MQGGPKTFSNELGRNEFWLQNRKLETIEANGHYFQDDETFKSFREVVGLLSCSFKEKVYFLIAVSLGGLGTELAEARDWFMQHLGACVCACVRVCVFQENYKTYQIRPKCIHTDVHGHFE